MKKILYISICLVLIVGMLVIYSFYCYRMESEIKDLDCIFDIESFKVSNYEIEKSGYKFVMDQYFLSSDKTHGACRIKLTYKNIEDAKDIPLSYDKKCDSYLTIGDADGGTNSRFLIYGYTTSESLTSYTSEDHYDVKYKGNTVYIYYEFKTDKGSEFNSRIYLYDKYRDGKETDLEYNAQPEDACDSFEIK